TGPPGGAHANTSIPESQTGKPTGRWDDMFDRHVVAGDDDAFQEKPHEPLATGEVEVGEARAQGGGEGGEILAQSSAPRAIHLLPARRRRRRARVHPRAARGRRAPRPVSPLYGENARTI